jgi:ribosomal-protein-alanine N-acetyltransferase
MAYGWEGELVRLVPLDLDKHFDNAVAWINDPEVTQYLAFGDFPMTKVGERAWFDERSKVNEKDIALAIETLDGTHIGFSGIFAVSWRDGTATTGTMIGDRSTWGKGYGTDAAITRNRYAFDVLGLRMLYSEVFEGNDRSYRMLAKAGYQECGRRPKRFWKRGQYRDEIIMFLDRAEWLRRSEEEN